MWIAVRTPATAPMKSVAVRAMVYAALLYLAAGLLFGALAGAAASSQGRVAWRLTAWVVSAIVFGAHIIYEQERLRSPATTAALHAALGAALGAFGLAAAANIHSVMAAQQQHAFALRLSLVIWPVMAALPAFLVALVAALLFARIRR